MAIAADEVKPLFAAPRMRGRIIVERRGEDRRQGHAPPIVAIAERDNLDAIMAALKPVAESDEILTQALEQRVTIPITSRRNPQS